jgi:hypothetical protein
MIGKTLGHYEITSRLGKGGMGEVYQAKDQKLGRNVAIKVLPEEFAKDADRVARFQREAKLLASLNHPNIAAIHGLEESGGTNFLVLELVEGDTLADRIKAGPVSVEESLKLALQIAEALEAAHEKGVIHRDLKPANIKVTPDGKIKVLDFGLAKAFAGEQADLNLSNSPTLSNAATQQGVILGTAAYMSPEQARGKPVDKRTDIWAFGAILFEMLTGQAAFQGEDVTEILAAVVKGGANLDLLPVNLHPRVHETVFRCLQKDLKKRYQDIGDVRFEIEQSLADPGGVFVQPAAATERQSKWRLTFPFIAAAVFMAALITGLAVWKLKPTPPLEPRQVTRFYYEMPKDQRFVGADERVLAVSPDGSQFIYATNEGLCLRSIDKLEARPIPGTDGNAERPFFSPDGKWVGYWSRSDNQLKRIAISGGAPAPIASIDSNGFFSWGADGTGILERLISATDRILTPASWSSDGKTLVLSEIALSPLQRDIGTLSMEGKRERKPLLEQKYGEYQPQISPDGHWMAYASAESGQAEIYVRPFPEADRGKWQISASGGENPLWSPQGRELFYRVGDAIMAVAVDTGQTFKFEKPKLLFRGSYASNRLGRITTSPWDISRDGKRFLMLKEATGESSPAKIPHKINIVLNWFEELKKLAPVK